jgi:glycosyltransferase involved in cell wall biosynthesis
VNRPRFLLTFLAWSSGLSGGDRHLLEVARRWGEHVDVALVAPRGAAATLRTIVGDAPVHELGRSVPNGPRLAVEYVRRAAAVTRKTVAATDAVIAASHFAPDAAAVRAYARAGAVGVSYVYHLIAGRSGGGLRTLWSASDERISLRLLRRYATIVFTSNAETTAALDERGFSPIRTAVGIDVASYSIAEPAALPPRAVFLARMAHVKGVRDAIEAWARVVRRVPGARLVMVGSGPELQPAQALAERLGVSAAVEWRGFVSEEEKRAILSDSRLLLAPSREEGWGIAVAEGLASGVPVVGYRLPVLDELFGSSYVGTPVGDVEALAAHAVEVLMDDALAARLSRGGREMVSRFDVERVAEHELEEILRHLPTR